MLIRGGRILDPSEDRDEAGDILIEAGTIAEVAAGLDVPGAEVLEAKGAWIAPGFVDLHCHRPARSTRKTSPPGGGRRSPGASPPSPAWPTPSP
jgi:dihydroorotase